MFCGKCGANISEGTKKCPNCGTRIGNNEFLGGFQDILRTDVSSMQDFRQQNYSAPVQQPAVYEPKKNNTLLFAAVGIAAVSLLLNLFLGIRLIGKNRTISEMRDTAAQQEDKIKSLESDLQDMEEGTAEPVKTPESAAGTAADSITGFVYLDNDRSSSYDPGTDQPYGSLTVELYLYTGDDLSDEYKLKETKTDQDGSFTFSQLADGTYRIVLVPDSRMEISEGAETISSLTGQSRPGIRKIEIPDYNNRKYSIGLIRLLKNEPDHDD